VIPERETRGGFRVSSRLTLGGPARRVRNDGEGREPGMNEIVSHYKGKTTSQGHKLEVKEKAGVVMIEFMHKGEYLDDYDPRIRVARIEQAVDVYTVGWFHEDFDEPSETSDYARKEDLFAALDHAIEKRSVEVGPPGS
jgi:hypothetical protein